MPRLPNSYQIDVFPTSYVDAGGGNGTWTYHFPVLPPINSSYAHLVEDAYFTTFVGAYMIQDYPWSPANGDVTFNGVTPDEVNYQDQYVFSKMNMAYEDVSGLVLVVTMANNTSWGPDDSWNNQNDAYVRYWVHNGWPIHWINPRTRKWTASTGGNMWNLYAGSYPTSPGYNATVINNWQVWGASEETYTRLRQRNDGLGTHDGTPPRIDVRSSSQQKSIRVPGQNTYR